MFSPRKRPLLLVADRLLALRLSLNTPVVATPDLPAGPARAAIAVHSESGRTCFTVAVRALRNGVSVLYELEGEDPNDASGVAVALDAALSFGESMGFLFDDELVTARSESVLRAALSKLREVVAPPSPDVGDTAPSYDLDAPSDEILLEEALELEPASAPAPVAPRPAAPPARPASASLTKFRMVAASGEAPPEGEAPPPEPPPEPEAPASAASTSPGTTARPAASRSATGGAMLGRVKPVRLRAPDAPAPIPAWIRLLSSF
jgi:hypothetical protein